MKGLQLTDGDSDDAAYVDFPIPKEYFYPVLINVLYHQGRLTDDLLTKEPWYPGTGFFYRIAGQNFLVTARHILSAHTWRENKPRDHPVLPTHVRISVRGLPSANGFDATSLPVSDIVLPLVDEHEEPIWLEHPEHREDVDIAVLPLASDLLRTDEFYYVPVEPEPPQGNTRFWVTQDVFVVGFPLGLHHGYLWPLWIRGTVASEPFLHFGFKGVEYPMFLIDARTRGGQSGSPVFIMRRSFAEDIGEHALPRTRLIGVYSGRANDEIADPKNPLPADLGFVWHTAVLDEICGGNTRGTIPK
jgi:hypothetical protein